MDYEKDFTKLNQRLANHIELDGEQYLYFSGTGYLGMAQNAKLIKQYIKGIDQYGLNNGTSRGNNVQQGIYDSAENFLAAHFGAEAALVSSSGYLAVSLTVRACQDKGLIRYAPDCHPSLWLNGKRKPEQQTNSFADWTKQLIDEINHSEQVRWLIISNSVNNLFPEVYDFSFLEQLSPDKQVTLLVDDSHGIGLLNGGKSMCQTLPKRKGLNLIVVASMAKALGIDAGLVLGTATQIEELKCSNEFYGASPPSAAALFAYMQSQNTYVQAYKQLQNNIDYFEAHLPNPEQWLFVKGLPIYLSKKEDLGTQLLQEKILISSFPYPDKTGKPLNRIVLNSLHQFTDLDRLLAVLKRC